MTYDETCATQSVYSRQQLYVCNNVCYNARSILNCMGSDLGYVVDISNNFVGVHGQIYDGVNNNNNSALLQGAATGQNY